MRKFIAFVAMVLVSMAATAVYAQEVPSDSVLHAVAVQALKENKFVVEADRLIFKQGDVAYVNSNTNFIMVDGEKGTVQVAFNNTPFAGPNGIGGITVDGRVSGVRVKESKKGDPMLSIWFKILTGEHKGHYIFMNQIVVTPFQSHVVDEFLKSLDTSIEIESLTVDHDYKRYSDMINDVYEQVNGHLEYLLNYSQNKKGYNTFSILEVYECE